jgi:hypothetical protein
MLIRKASNLALLIIPILFSTACNSAPSNKLQTFNYKDATRFFQNQHHDSPGVWSCSYTKNKLSENTTSPEVLMQEIDEAYLYIKQNDNIVELALSSKKENFTEYKNIPNHLSARIKIIKRSNYSEYQESHDRIVEVKIKTPENNYSLHLLGEACGI